MANTAGVTNSFKSNILSGRHCLSGTAPIRATSAVDTLKAALYLTTASITPSTSTYTATGEASGTGYTAGGVAVSNGTVSSTSGTAYWTPGANIDFVTVTVGPVDAILIYNSSQSNLTIAVCTFASLSVTAGTLSITMPPHNVTNALIRIV